MTTGEAPGVDGTGAGPYTGDQSGERLTHLDDAGTARMVDVGGKPITDRVATATAVVVMRPDVAARLQSGDLPKGDAIPVARLAGIQAAKRTPELIPLCHHVALTSVEVAITIDAEGGRATVAATARATDRTGVEMEAMVAAAVASLTIYDLVKAVQRDVVVTDVRLTHKSGGRTGTFTAAANTVQ